MNMSKTWCPDCKREVLNVVGFIADGWEFTCGKCNQRFAVRFERVLTKRAADFPCCCAEIFTAGVVNPDCPRHGAMRANR